MTLKRDTKRKTRVYSLAKLFGRRIGRRLVRTSSKEFRKLSPPELKKLGLSAKSERYVERSAKRLTSATPTLSKRQFYQKKLGETTGRPVTLERRAQEYLSGEREALTSAQASLRERSLQAWRLKQKYKKESISRIRQHLRHMDIKERGDYLDRQTYLREKAFAEAHLDVPEENTFYQKWFNYGHVKMV
jgi:hypothetical protein